MRVLYSFWGFITPLEKNSIVNTPDGERGNRVDFVNELIDITPDRLHNGGSLAADWNYIGDRVLRNLDMSYRVASEKDETGAIKILEFKSEM